MFLGIWRLAISIPEVGQDKIWYYNGQYLEFSGWVSAEPDIRVNNQKIEVSAIEYQGKILLSADLYPKYEYGDILNIGCSLKEPEPFEGFAYDRYLARYGVYSVCYYPKIERVDKKKDIKTVILRGAFVFKDKMRTQVERSLSEPEAGLAKAMLLGDKRAISDDLREDLSRSGLSHIAAISGLHISIISGILFVGLIYVGLDRRQSFYASSVLLFLYITLIGFPASALRAGLMGFLVLLAMHLGRLNRLVHSLMIAACMILIFNPKLLRDDIGFQLSFLAVLGIALIYPWLKRVSGREGLLWDVVFVSLSAQVFTLPLVAYNFGVISFVSPLSNLLVLWLLPFLLIFCISATFLSLLIPPISVFVFIPAFFMLKYIVFIAEILSFGAVVW